MTFYMTYIFTVKFDILKINTKIENVLRPGEGEFPLSAPLTTPLVVKQIGWFDSNFIADLRQKPDVTFEKKISLATRELTPRQRASKNTF